MCMYFIKASIKISLIYITSILICVYMNIVSSVWASEVNLRCFFLQILRLHET